MTCDDLHMIICSILIADSQRPSMLQDCWTVKKNAKALKNRPVQNKKLKVAVVAVVVPVVVIVDGLTVIQNHQ